jgi:hypothetical protein
MLGNVSNEMRRIFVHRHDSYFVVWVTDDIPAVQERLLCVKLVKSRYVTLSIATHIITLPYVLLRSLFVRYLPGFYNCIRFSIILTNTQHCYLPELVQSFPHHDIQFRKLHLIIKLPSVSRSPTYLLVITTVLKQIWHELNDTTVFVV